MEIKIWFQFCFAIQINLCNLTAIQEDCSRIAEIAVGLLRLQLDCWDCKVSATYIYGWSSHRVSGRLRDIGLQFCFAIQINLCILTAMQQDCSLIAEMAVWFWKWVKIGGPEIEASHWLRAQNWGLWLVERTGFEKFKTLAFRSEISHSTHSRWQSPQSDCNLHKQTAICIIRLQSPKFDSNLYNQTAISTIELQSQQSDCNAGGLQSDCWDCTLIVEIAHGLLRLQYDCWYCTLIAEIADIPQLTYTVGHPTACRGGCVRTASRQWD